jgi:hypothetical protein
MLDWQPCKAAASILSEEYKIQQREGKKNMAAQRRKKIWNTRRLPQQSDEPGLQQWWKWHKKEFLKNKINTRIQKNLMCWKKKKKGEKTSHQGAPFNWRSYSEALATMRLW